MTLSERIVLGCTQRSVYFQLLEGQRLNADGQSCQPFSPVADQCLKGTDASWISAGGV